MGGPASAVCRTSRAICGFSSLKPARTARQRRPTVHGWDLAQATGQPALFPDRLAEQELAFTRHALADLPAGRSPFGPPQPVATDAPAIDRLAACLGRAVTTGGRSE